MTDAMPTGATAMESAPPQLPTEPTHDDRSPSGCSLSSGRRWSAPAPLVTAAFLPARTARATTHLSLWVVYAIHWLGLLLAVLTLFFVAAGGEIGELLRVVGDTLLLLESAWMAQPLKASLFFLAVVLGVEGGTVLLAVPLSGWGARDEPLRDSLRWSLQRCWVYAPSLAVVSFLVGIPAVLLKGAHEAYIQTHFRGFEDWLQTVRAMPFWVLYWEDLANLWAAVCGLVWFLGLLAAIAAERPHRRPTVRPPLCDACGYDLTASAMDGRCPECGQAVALSLGPQVRPGAPWLQRRSLGWWTAWRRTGELAMYAAPRLGRLLRVHEPRTDHRRYPVLVLAVVFLLGWLTIPLAHAAGIGKNAFQHEPALVWITGSVFGWCALTVALAILAGSGTVVGLYARWRTGRNLLPVAMQAACYASPWLVVWASIFLVGIMCAFAVEPSLGRGGPTPPELLPLALAASHLVCDLIYLRLIGRATFAARYANR